jgi:hypothetical protein
MWKINRDANLVQGTLKGKNLGGRGGGLRIY